MKNTDSETEYTIWSGLESPKWWVIFGSISYYNYSRYDIKIKNLNRQYNEAVMNQPQVIQEYTYLLKISNYGVSVCKDGWVSQTGGQGACSHHGGVKYDISSRLKSLQYRIDKYNEVLSPYWYDSKQNKIQEFHLWFEVGLLIFLLFLYKAIHS